MSKAGALLAARILAAINDLNTVVKRAIQGWERTKTRNDDYYLDGVALNLHGFYSGLERVFEKIALAVDGSVPSGANWHRELLNQMSINEARTDFRDLNRKLRLSSFQKMVDFQDE